MLIAADGGLDHARAAGLEPAVLVGDLDSISALGLAWASEHTEVVRHPIDKAATDTELAIAHAATLRARTRILLVAGQGDRLDHAVAALGALGAPALAAVGSPGGVVGQRPAARRPRPGSTTLDLPAGTTFSVLAMHGPCEGVTVDGARWPLARPRPRPARRPRRQQPGRRRRRSRWRSSAASSPSSSPEPPREPPSAPSPPSSPSLDGGRACVAGVRRRRRAVRRITLVDLRLVPGVGHARSTTRSPTFTEETGIDVELLVAGDTGTMVSKAVLTAGNPEGDVMFGVDNTFLSRVVDDDVFEPYEAAGLDDVPDELRALVPDGEATPVDFGDVCVNYDIGLVRRARPRPARRPRRAGRPGVRRPARRREPGDVVARAGVPAGDDRRVRRGRLARLLDAAPRQRRRGRRRLDRGLLRAVLRRRRRPQAARRQLRHQPAGRGRVRRPADRRRRRRRSIDTTCFRQVEFAGVLRGTEHADEARQLVDFLLSPSASRPSCR